MMIMMTYEDLDIIYILINFMQDINNKYKIITYQ